MVRKKQLFSELIVNSEITPLSELTCSSRGVHAIPTAMFSWVNNNPHNIENIKFHYPDDTIEFVKMARVDEHNSEIVFFRNTSPEQDTEVVYETYWELFKHKVNVKQ